MTRAIVFVVSPMGGVMPRWCEVPSRAYGVGIDVSRTSVLSVESLVGAFPGRSSMGNVRRRMTGLTVAGGGVPFDQLGTVPGVRMRADVIGQELVRAGEPLDVDASSSYTAFGHIRRWQWDLDGDRHYEITTTKAPR